MEWEDWRDEGVTHITDPGQRTMCSQAQASGNLAEFLLRPHSLFTCYVLGTHTCYC